MQTETTLSLSLYPLLDVHRGFWDQERQSFSPHLTCSFYYGGEMLFVAVESDVPPIRSVAYNSLQPLLCIEY